MLLKKCAIDEMYRLLVNKKNTNTLCILRSVCITCGKGEIPPRSDSGSGRCAPNCSQQFSRALRISFLSFMCIKKSLYNKGFFDIRGEGEIRTLDGLASIPLFESGAFNRSATSP